MCRYEYECLGTVTFASHDIIRNGDLVKFVLDKEYVLFRLLIHQKYIETADEPFTTATLSFPLTILADHFIVENIFLFFCAIPSKND